MFRGLKSASALLSAALLLLSGCTSGVPLEGGDLDEARRLWQSAAVTNYRLTLEVKGDRIQTGVFAVVYGGGQVKDVTRNGAPLTVHDPFYSIDGLFALLESELEMAANPARYWGAKDDAQVHQRVRFHRTLGYPEHYLRAVFGTDQNITITVKDFTAE